MSYWDESYPADLLVAPGPFVLTGLAPATAVQNTAPVVVNANGTNFTKFSKVIFDGKEVPTTFVSASQVRFTAPSHATGVISVKVKNGGSLTGAQSFTYTATQEDESDPDQEPKRKRRAKMSDTPEPVEPEEPDNPEDPEGE